MLYRKILVNLLAAWLAPLVQKARWLPNLFDAVFYQQYRYYDFQIYSLKEFFIALYGQTYTLTVFLSLVLFFLPFQLIKDYYRRSGKNKSLTFVRKWMLLTGIVLGWFLLSGYFFFLIVTLPRYLLILFIIFPPTFGLIFTALFHFMIDKHEDLKQIPTGHETNTTAT